ncbi:formin-like protein 13 isoform X6, partial [Tanacetum coccineum]
MIPKRACCVNLKPIGGRGNFVFSRGQPITLPDLGAFGSFPLPLSPGILPAIYTWFSRSLYATWPSRAFGIITWFIAFGIMFVSFGIGYVDIVRVGLMSLMRFVNAEREQTLDGRGGLTEFAAMTDYWMKLIFSDLDTTAFKQSNKLKALHWLKLTRALSGSLWPVAQKSGEALKAPEIDMSELESLFPASNASAEQRDAKLKSRVAIANKPKKVLL